MRRCKALAIIRNEAYFFVRRSDEARSVTPVSDNLRNRRTRRRVMEKPEYHIFVCNSFRVAGDPQGVCNRKDAVSLLQILEEEVGDRGLDAMVSSTGCR